MSDKLPRSSQQRIARTPFRKQFLAVSDALAKQETAHASWINGSNGQQQAQAPALLQMEQIQTTAPLPAVNGNGNYRLQHFQEPSPLHSREIQTTGSLSAAAMKNGTSVTAGSGEMQAMFLLPI